MDANLLSPSFNASLNVALPAATAPAALGAALRGADFANLLGSLLADPGRQGIAAAGLAEAGLRAVPLGPQIELITAAAPVPDTGSLMAFARSQGLNESTLAALFGDLAEAPPAGVNGLSATAASAVPSYFLGPPLTPLNVSQQALPAAVALTLPAPAVSAYLLPGQTALQQPQAVMAPTATESMLLEDLNLTPTATPVMAAYFLSAQSFQPQPLQPQSVQLQPAVPAALPVMPALSTLAAVQNAALATVATTDLAWQVSKTPVQTPLTGAAAVGDVQPISADEAMQDALRVQLLLPREAVTALTRRLATMTGNGQAQVWGNLAAGAVATAGPTPLNTLNMREFFAPFGMLAEPTDAADAADALQASDADSVVTLPTDGSRKASGSLTLTPEAVVPSQAGQRAEHYQQLADRLGQALGQRLQAQIERGEWKMQMRMDPASLGRIDLELQMRSGGLDAIFRSDNPLTRELIAQGLPKLRDSLSQSGTAVANVWVNGDSARQSGGNPTPFRTPRSSPQTPSDADSGSGQSTAAALPVAGVRQGGSSSALDVLA
jgi:flagellar hook-length control protein FliK